MISEKENLINNMQETINKSLSIYIEDFETKNNTKISDIMNFQNNFKEMKTKTTEKK